MSAGTGVLTFDVPLPPKAVDPNGAGRAWQGAMRGKAQYRERVRDEAIIAARLAGWELHQRVRVTLVFGIDRSKKARARDPGYRPRDVGNAISAFKAGFDGLVDAGIMPDDDHRHMELGNVSIRPDLGPGVTVIVARLD